MAGHIPRSFIDELLNRHDIVDIIDARVKLKKNKGKTMVPAVHSIMKNPLLSL